jgi:hypothetical protein
MVLGISPATAASSLWKSLLEVEEVEEAKAVLLALFAKQVAEVAAE